MGKDLNGKELGKGYSQRRDGRYEARIKINGRQIDIYDFSLPKLKKTFELEKAKVLREERSVDNSITLGQWFDEWFEKCKAPQLKSELSIASYKKKIKNTYIRLLRDKKLSSITQLNIQDATNELLNENYSERGVREALGVLRGCLDAALANRIIVINPCQQILIKDGNECQKERRVLELWEQELFLEEVANSYYNEAYQFLLLTGVRIGEFSGLQWNDVDWEKKVVRISRTMSTGYFNGRKVEELSTPKTLNSYREIPFFGETESVLKSWREKQNRYKASRGDRWRANPELGDLIFTNTLGSPVTRYVIAHDLGRIERNMNLKEESRAFYEGREPRKIEHLHPHCFRHTFATRCFEKGMSPLIVQSIMGHANYNTTISYTHVLQNKRNEEVNKIGNFLN